ncbi:hypothetical protein [Vibrio furnissii]|uniref:hypothetical protein n=1 Tax=Vibrio furnissii TaxID=29494 RepID=UPI001D5AAAE3|nr:hypothetical protein [Vibrio furnissii]MBY7933111.1 hypothetical protein [Vibrio fluvialis]MCG6230222.1 hypothetical protein [Vibrio furnissii]MCG6268490.1 hypothetical protein [Vibrio furnissii]
MMEALDWVLLILAIGIFGFFWGGFRSEKARQRLQACIDNGKAQFDGYSVTPTVGITESERIKIEIEIIHYVTARRNFGYFPRRLHHKNSAN